MTNTHTAKRMWDAYAFRAGGITFDGKPLPTWDELGEDRQSCWVAATSVAADRIETLVSALRKIADIEHEDLPKPVCAAEGTLWVILAGCVEVAEKALEGKDD
jgi:hypothetical protein